METLTKLNHQQIKSEIFLIMEVLRNNKKIANQQKDWQMFKQPLYRNTCDGMIEAFQIAESLVEELYQKL